jgi:hypothetical protein
MIAVVMVHVGTSAYINENEVERSLGIILEVYAGYIPLTFSQYTLCSTYSHPNACCGRKEPSQ